MKIATLFGLTLLLMPACGADGSAGATGTGSSGSGGAGGVADDGKYHPPTNGVVIDEADACGRVEAAFKARLNDLVCVATAPSCPGLIQAPTGAPPCSSFDEGTAQGCAEYVTESADCDELKVRIGDCIVEPIEDSAPNGCPS